MIDKVFTPEKVRKLALKFRIYTPEAAERWITDWLEQNQPEPVVVGLSDSSPNWDAAPDLAGWITIDDDGMQSWHELEPYFDENMWAYGSDGANGVMAGISLRKIFKRPKPKTQVEVGQVWRWDAGEKIYNVKIIGVDKDCVCIEYIYDGRLDLPRINDFLAKFEHVERGPE